MNNSKLGEQLKKVFGPNVEVINFNPDPVSTGQDTSEDARMKAVDEINAKQAQREALEKEHDQVWDVTEMQRDFEVEGFMAPYVVVRRRSDGKRGTLTFQHWPRFYWGFLEDR